MPFDYNSILGAQAERIAADQAQAVADLEAARMRDDSDGTMYAAERILELDARRNALAQRANQYYASQQAQPRGNKYGLNRDEVEVAHGLASGDPKMSNEERERIYAENRARYQHMRATGQYRDDQGTVTR